MTLYKIPHYYESETDFNELIKDQTGISHDEHLKQFSLWLEKWISQQTIMGPNNATFSGKTNCQASIKPIFDMRNKRSNNIKKRISKSKNSVKCSRKSIKK